MKTSFWIGVSVVLLCSVVAASAADFIVNTTNQCVTDNWMDGGARYWYRLTNGELEYKTGQSWQSFPQLPYAGCRFKNIAANNNRLLGLTTNNELYLANIIGGDVAQWVINVLDGVAVLGDLASPILVALGVYTEGSGYRLGTVYYLTPSDWATAYHEYIEGYHQPWTWAPVDREGINYEEIQDIAIGNWNGTVTTMYVLDAQNHYIYWIDEEPVMFEWKQVKDSRTLGLTPESRIDADHSVICATTADHVHWVRFDFHQPDQLPILNWTELPYAPPFDNPSDHPGWHHIGNPTGLCDGFRIDVRSADGTSWPIPKFLNLFDLEGMLGENPIDPPWQYPVRLIMTDEMGTDNYFRMRLRHAKEMDTMPAVVNLDGDHSFAFAVPQEDAYYFGTQTADPNEYLSDLGEDCYIHAKDTIIITNGIKVDPQPMKTFRAVVIP